MTPGYIEKIKRLKGPIFVFGASGFLGANVFDSIFKVRTDCYAITHQYLQAWRLKLLNVPYGNIIHIDVISLSSVKNAFEKFRPETIFDLAAYGAYSKQQNVNLIYETNVLGVVNVLDNCSDVSAYFHA